MNSRQKVALGSVMLIGLFFMLFFSYSTSPLYPDYYGGDTAQFLTMGKGWSKGLVPYVDMFDHKGPFIYFIDMLGFLCFGTKSGVFLFQIPFMFASVYGFWKLGSLYKEEAGVCAFAALIGLITMKVNYMEGNTVEEYCLPFLIWSIYGLLYFVKTRCISMWMFLVWGLSCSMALLTRATNLVPVVGGFLFFLVLCLLEKRGALIWKAFLFGFAGFALLFVPFFLYFWWKGAVYDLFYGMVLFNIEYADGNASWITYATGDMIGRFMKDFFASYVLLIPISLSCIRKEREKAVLYGMLLVPQLCLYFSGQAFAQYALVCAPQVVLAAGEIMDFLEMAIKKQSGIQLFGGFLLTTFLGIFLVASIGDFAMARDISNGFSVHHRRGWEGLMQVVPQEDKDSFVCYGENEFKELYLIADVLPCYKYFVIQNWHSSFSQKVAQEVQDTFASRQAKWILTDAHAEKIAGILESYYNLVGVDGEYFLYRRNEVG